MQLEILSSCTVITKDNKHYEYVIEDGISLEELTAYFTNEYKENINIITLGPNVGYLQK